MLCWNVYYGSCNERKIKVMNIFNHHYFYRDCVKAKKKFKDDRIAFEKEIKSLLMYYFWSKCEWEIILSHWPSGEAYEMRTKTTVGELVEKIGCKNGWMKPDTPVTVRVYPDCLKRDEEKIDVYDQVINNWEPFMDYVWEHRKELKAREG